MLKRKRDLFEIHLSKVRDIAGCRCRGFPRRRSLPHGRVGCGCGVHWHSEGHLGTTLHGTHCLQWQSHVGALLRLFVMRFIILCTSVIMTFYYNSWKVLSSVWVSVPMAADFHISLFRLLQFSTSFFTSTIQLFTSSDRSFALIIQIIKPKLIFGGPLIIPLRKDSYLSSQFSYLGYWDNYPLTLHVFFFSTSLPNITKDLMNGWKGKIFLTVV